MLKRIAVSAVILCLPVFFAHSQAAQDFTGRVFDAQSKRGVENLEIRLRPPTASNLPTLMGYTNQNGEFRFSAVSSSRYLLEVSQGPYPLYRHEVDLSQTHNIEIPIERR